VGHKSGGRGANKKGCLRPESVLRPPFTDHEAEVESRSWSILGASDFLKSFPSGAFQTK